MPRIDTLTAVPNAEVSSILKEYEDDGATAVATSDGPNTSTIVATYPDAGGTADTGATPSNLKAANLTRWQKMRVDPNLIPSLTKVANSLAAQKARYQAVSELTDVPWFIIAVIHEREASQSFAANLAQGDPWNTISVHDPAGRGPFASWEDAAVDALTKCPPHAANWQDWTIGGALTLLEQYNGLGYAARGVPSPYIWASTDQYVMGKFVSDHHYDPTAVDHQLGCAALLKIMRDVDNTINLNEPAVA
jgi:lysozyme family protein